MLQFKTSVLAAILCLLPTAGFATVNHGDYLGIGVDFLQVSETTQTALDPEPIWLAPILAITGNQLLFTPSSFISSCGPSGGSDSTASLLTMTIESQPGVHIEELALQEAGDAALGSFLGFGSLGTGASADISGTVTVLEDIGGPIVPVVIPFSGTFTPSSSFDLPIDYGANSWTGLIVVKVKDVVPNATVAVLELTNTLDSSCEVGDFASIQKKSVSGPAIALAINSLPCDLELEKTCCTPPPSSAGLDQCEGKMLSLELRYLDNECSATTNTQSGKARCSGGMPGGAVDVVVGGKDPNKYAIDGVDGGNGSYLVDESFTVTSPTGANGGEFKASVKLRLDGPKDSQSLTIHTSCSKAISCGDIFGSLEVVGLESTLGGVADCSEPEPEEEGPQTETACLDGGNQGGTVCTERPVEIVFEYVGAECNSPLPQGKAACSGDATGATDVSIVYTGKDSGDFTLTPASNINDHDLVAVTATGTDELKASTKLLIQDAGGQLQALTIHTSCSQPLACGDLFGSLRVAQFTEQDGVVVSCITEPPGGGPFEQACTVPLAPAGPHCKSSVKALQLVYIDDLLGEGCTVSNGQGGNASCTGVASPGDPVSVTITQDPLNVIPDPAAGIAFGDIITIAREDGTKLGATTKFDVSGAGGTQSIELHTSCSKSLNLGDRFGSMVVFGLETDDEGMVQLGGIVEYQYKVTSPLTNTGDVQASVVDDPNGDGDLSDEVEIATNITLVPGESRTFFDTRTLYGTTTNIATASSAFGSSVTCTPAMDSVDVTVTAPPAGPFDCKDAKPIDELTMEWAGLGGDVCVRAWDGAVGGTQLGADQDDVALGDLVTVSGMGGSPNDQYWQIFAAGDCGGEEIGQSTFHISCSDSSMNGAEDCGKIQGDGKDNIPSLITTWLLEGMKGDSAELQCSGNEEIIIPDLCGFGPGLLLALPGLLWLHRRRLRREA